MKTQIIFKITFIIGIALSFLSLFFDYYNYKGYNETGELVLSWNLSFIFNWTTSLDETSYNDVLRPQNLGIPIEIHIIFIVLLIVSIFIILFKDIIGAKDFKNLQPYVYILFALVLFLGFYIFIIPIFYLINNKLLFPIITYPNEDIGIIFHYSINFGYLLEFISFILIFPYVALYFYIIQNYEITQDDFEKKLKEILIKENEPFDIDKFIAEEYIKTQFQKVQRNEELKLKSQIIHEGGI
ncbi:MAG: hypothetical protein KGD63_14250 [Candidatus Lokiarchaeota archaeon]|nr:hypothetical protein [Candidatus Lokiarchaeota archaeon]